MNRENQSGNSYTELIKANEKSIFRKKFAEYRRYQYFNEYLMNRYLYAINPGFVSNILDHSHTGSWIDYEAHNSTKSSVKNALIYTDLISEIHQKTDRGSVTNRLLASEPLIDFEKFSSRFMSRIKEIELQSTILHTKLSRSIDAIKQLHLNLITKLEGHVPNSRLIFSHADSGLHNSLTNSEGRMMLADLEYAGYDSPIKQCIDYLIHPKTQAYSESFSYWYEYFIEEQIHKKDLKILNIFGALLALKWSIIMLNEFKPLNWKLRVLSSPSRESKKMEILTRQYNKAELYYRGAGRLADGHSPVKLFTEGERDLLSYTY